MSDIHNIPDYPETFPVPPQNAAVAGYKGWRMAVVRVADRHYAAAATYPADPPDGRSELNIGYVGDRYRTEKAAWKALMAAIDRGEGRP